MEVGDLVRASPSHGPDLRAPRRCSCELNRGYAQSQCKRAEFLLINQEQAAAQRLPLKVAYGRGDSRWQPRHSGRRKVFVAVGLRSTTDMCEVRLALPAIAPTYRSPT